MWNEWGIQILVLLSFTLQVFLVSFAGIRRRNASSPLRLLLWLVYLLADSTAIYTLGHLSVASSKAQDQQHLLAFWAPFLLVHLGGPGNITAYALEDKRLWLRHLLTLLVQVLGAAFVIYKYITGGRTLVLVAAMVVFVVGVVRYGERTVALRCGSESSIRSMISSNMLTNGTNEYSVSFGFGGSIGKVTFPFPDPPDNIDDEELLLGAQSLFFVCQNKFVDATIYLSEYLVCSCRVFGRKDLFGLVEMELSLMYDILYTKAAVFHTLYGYCILVVSPLATAAALVLFHLSNKHGDGKVNVAISYALLIGTLALETISVVGAIGSTWACTRMFCSRRWNRLLGALTFLRRRFKAASRRRWSGFIGQYNLLHLSTRDRTELGGKLAAWLGLGRWWRKVHYSGTTAISATDLKNQILRVRRNINARNSRGVDALDSMGLDTDSTEYARWILSTVDFDDSILFWHIATDIYLYSTQIEHDENLITAVQVLSNYMLFLLMAQPGMLPGPIRQGQYDNTCGDLDRLWDHCSANRNQGGPVSESTQKGNTLDKLFRKLKKFEKLFHRDEPNDSRIREREVLARQLLETNFNIATRQWKDPTTRIRPPSSRTGLSAYIEGPLLAGELLHVDSDSMLEVIFRVWVEMLCYAAHHCSRDSHARQLNNGGEFLTVIWLLAAHAGFIRK